MLFVRPPTLPEEVVLPLKDAEDELALRREPDEGRLTGKEREKTRPLCVCRALYTIRRRHRSQRSSGAPCATSQTGASGLSSFSTESSNEPFLDEAVDEPVRSGGPGRFKERVLKSKAFDSVCVEKPSRLVRLRLIASGKASSLHRPFSAGLPVARARSVAKASQTTRIGSTAVCASAVVPKLFLPTDAFNNTSAKA